MEDMDKNNALIVIGVLAVIIEILLGAVTGFDLLLIGIIFVTSGSLGLISNSFSLAMIAIGILSFFYIFVGRKLIKNKLSIETKLTNIDSIIGKKGVVIKKIKKNRAGQIKIEGEIWRAEAGSDIDERQVVVVHSVSGVTLKVSSAH